MSSELEQYNQSLPKIKVGLTANKLPIKVSWDASKLSSLMETDFKIPQGFLKIGVNIFNANRNNPDTEVYNFPDSSGYYGANGTNVFLSDRWGISIDVGSEALEEFKKAESQKDEAVVNRLQSDLNRELFIASGLIRDLDTLHKLSRRAEAASDRKLSTVMYSFEAVMAGGIALLFDQPILSPETIGLAAILTSGTFAFHAGIEYRHGKKIDLLSEQVKDKAYYLRTDFNEHKENWNVIAISPND